MSIKAIAVTEVISTPRDSTLKDVARLMQSQHIGSVVVTESYDGKPIPVGIVTDRDLALTLASHDSPQNMKVESVMPKSLITARANDEIFETIMKMSEHGIKRMPVISHDGSLYGIVCADDLLRIMGDEIHNLAQLTDLQIHREKQLRSESSRTIYV